MNQETIKEFMDAVLRNSHQMNISWFRRFNTFITSLETVKEENININMNYYSAIIDALVSDKTCEFVRRVIVDMQEVLGHKDYKILTLIFDNTTNVTRFIKEVIYYIMNDYFIYNRYLLMSKI